MENGQRNESPNETAIAEFCPEHTLDYWVKTRAGNKRNYIFDYGKARSCDHPTMTVIARGGNMYRCHDCNYVHQWPGAITWPLHFTVIQGMFQAMYFAKEFGMASLMEVLRRPIGQGPDEAHKPVLPEGMSFMDVLEELEKVDVTSVDGGAAQLRKMLDEVWVDGRAGVGAGPDLPELEAPDGNGDSEG